MADKYLNLTGLTYYDEKIKAYIATSISPKFTYTVSSSVATTPNITTYHGTQGTLSPSASTMYIIYLVEETVGASDMGEFMTVDNGSSANPRYTWEKIGSTAADLSNYVPKTTKVNNKALSSDITLDSDDLEYDGSAFTPTSTTLTGAFDYLYNIISGINSSYVDKAYFTAKGALLVGTGASTYTTLAVGSENKILKVVSGTPSWETEYSYSLPLAASGTRGGIQIGYTQSGKNYPVQLSSEKAYVNVPWTDTTYESKAAVSGGTDVSLVTTGEKYDWNNKTSNVGTVTSVRVQATSPVVSSTSTAQSVSLNTTISLADAYGDTKNPYSSKTKQYVLAAPAAADGVPSFRRLATDDISFSDAQDPACENVNDALGFIDERIDVIESAMTAITTAEIDALFA